MIFFPYITSIINDYTTSDHVPTEIRDYSHVTEAFSRAFSYFPSTVLENAKSNKYVFLSFTNLRHQRSQDFNVHPPEPWYTQHGSWSDFYLEGQVYQLTYVYICTVQFLYWCPTRFSAGSSSALFWYIHCCWPLLFPIRHSCFCTDLKISISPWMVTAEIPAKLSCRSLERPSHIKILWSSWTILRSQHLNCFRDSQMFFWLHITKLTQSCRFLFNNTRGICPFLTTEASWEVLGHSFHLQDYWLVCVPSKSSQLNQNSVMESWCVVAAHTNLSNWCLPTKPKMAWHHSPFELLVWLDWKQHPSRTRVFPFLALRW